MGGMRSSLGPIVTETKDSYEHAGEVLKEPYTLIDYCIFPRHQYLYYLDGSRRRRQLAPGLWEQCIGGSETLGDPSPMRRYRMLGRHSANDIPIIYIRLLV